jgi:hypothetical protein
MCIPTLIREKNHRFHSNCVWKTNAQPQSTTLRCTPPGRVGDARPNRCPRRIAVVAAWANHRPPRISGVAVRAGSPESPDHRRRRAPPPSIIPLRRAAPPDSRSWWAPTDVVLFRGLARYIIVRQRLLHHWCSVILFCCSVLQFSVYVKNGVLIS